MKKSLLILVLACFLALPVTGQTFKPWGAGVKVGDETVRLKIRNTGTGAPVSEEKKISGAEERARENKPGAVYNGVQGGSWFLIRFFQIVISPQDGPSCRYHPTCSNYGKQAVEKFGALLGAMMAGNRLIRCNPYNPAGENPVPDSLFNDK